MGSEKGIILMEARHLVLGGNVLLGIIRFLSVQGAFFYLVQQCCALRSGSTKTCPYFCPC
jgi:hypothetical protein